MEEERRREMVSLIRKIISMLRKPDQVRWFRLPIEKRLWMSSNAIIRIL